MAERITTLTLMERIPDEASAWEYLEDLRWDGKPMCPHCGNEDRCYFLTPQAPRTTSTGAVTVRRLWKCAECRQKFSATTGTIMHGSKIPIRTWIMVIFEMASNKNGTAAREVQRRYGLTAKSAWFLVHRIREAMKDDGLDLLGGEGHVIVADETVIGGSLPSMNKKTRARAEAPERVVPGTPHGAGPAFNKTSVLSLIDTDTGQVRSRIVPDVTGASLRKAIADQVRMSRSTLHTDESKSYLAVGSEFAAHESVNHKQGVYARYTDEGVVTSNQAENFFSQLKRSIDGTHHHVSRKHLHRYLGEFDFRYSTRDESDTRRMRIVIDQAAGRRLTYRPLVAAV